MRAPVTTQALAPAERAQLVAWAGARALQDAGAGAAPRMGEVLTAGVQLAIATRGPAGAEVEPAEVAAAVWVVYVPTYLAAIGATDAEAA